MTLSPREDWKRGAEQLDRVEAAAQRMALVAMRALEGLSPEECESRVSALEKVALAYEDASLSPSCGAEADEAAAREWLHRNYTIVTEPIVLDLALELAQARREVLEAACSATCVHCARGEAVNHEPLAGWFHYPGQSRVPCDAYAIRALPRPGAEREVEPCWKLDGRWTGRCKRDDACPACEKSGRHRPPSPHAERKEMTNHVPVPSPTGIDMCHFVLQPLLHGAEICGRPAAEHAPPPPNEKPGGEARIGGRSREQARDLLWIWMDAAGMRAASEGSFIDALISAAFQREALVKALEELGHGRDPRACESWGYDRGLPCPGCAALDSVRK
jgi:hypothetical protein